MSFIIIARLSAHGINKKHQNFLQPPKSNKTIESMYGMNAMQYLVWRLKQKEKKRINNVSAIWREGNRNL